MAGDAGFDDDDVVDVCVLMAGGKFEDGDEEVGFPVCAALLMRRRDTVLNQALESQIRCFLQTDVLFLPLLVRS